MKVIIRPCKYSCEFIIVPKGVEHRPVAKQEVSVMLFEPKSTLNTGDKDGRLTKHKIDNI